MAGHSKWSKVKRIKGPLDVKRGQLFSRLSKEITLAAKMGGGDPSGNVRLRSAIQSARDQNMPSDNIDRAIKKGTGELEGNAMEEMVYEGYAPGGVALLIETATDNKNRTASDIRLIFTKHHSHLAAVGSVAYLFQRKGLITVPRSAADEDRIMEIALEAGAQDMVTADETFEITTPVDRFYAVAEALRKGGVTPESQKLVYIPNTHVLVADEHLAQQVMHLHDALEENDDVQHVHMNLELSEALLTKLSA
ncbi:transcriptional regulator [Verrucomicrobia bacterium SCGC AG-212-E04]|nr:transcriptional regulator [Verrucomicrobia bacterium SCGC AG-212-E04]